MTLLVLCGVLAILAVLADNFFELMWWPPYFRHGLLVYRTSTPYPAARLEGPRFMPTGGELEGEFEGLFIRQITFHQLGENEVALRKRRAFRLWGEYTSLLHGRMTLDTGADRVIIEARANWAPLAMAMLGFAAGREEQVGGLWVLFGALSFFSALSLIDIFANRQIVRGVADRMFEYNRQTAPSHPTTASQ